MSRPVHALLLVGVLLLVASAAWSGLARHGAARVYADLHASESLHYPLHLAAGRLFSLCPCSYDLARDQYDRAGVHATSPRQVALVSVTPSVPQTTVALIGGVALGLLTFLVGIRIVATRAQRAPRPAPARRLSGLADTTLGALTARG